MKTILRVRNWDNYQHYKKKNQNYNFQQPWFKFYGRTLLNHREFMIMSPEDRDFLIVGCWAIGSQNDGFLPELSQHAFFLRADESKVEKKRELMLKTGWLEEWDLDEFENR